MVILNKILYVLAIITIYNWVNYNDLTVLPTPGIMVYFQEIILKWPKISGKWNIIIYLDSFCSRNNKLPVASESRTAQ